MVDGCLGCCFTSYIAGGPSQVEIAVSGQYYVYLEDGRPSQVKTCRLLTVFSSKAAEAAAAETAVATAAAAAAAGAVASAAAAQ